MKDPKPAWEFKTEYLQSGSKLIVSREVRQQTLADDSEQIEMALEDILSCMDRVERFDTSTGANELLSPSVPRSKRFVCFTDRYMVKDRNTLTAFDASEGVLYLLFSAARVFDWYNHKNVPKVFKDFFLYMINSTHEIRNTKQNPNKLDV